MENMQIGLMLMAVGMITVFVILLVVINFSKILILLVNKFAPEEVQEKKKPAPAPAKVDARVMAIIEATVAQLTANKGTVTNVEKL